MRDLLREGWDGIASHPVRSVLSTIGILCGVAAVIGILSIGEGARREQEVLIEQLGTLTFQIRQRDLGDTVEAKEVRRLSRGLSTRDLEALREVLPGAEHVGGMREVEVREMVPKPPDTSALGVVGADLAYLAGAKVALARGRHLTRRDMDTAAAVALVGPAAERALFGPTSGLGRRVRLGQVWVTVVGVLAPAAGGGGAQIQGVDVGDRSAQVILPLSTARQRFARPPGEPELTEILVSLRSMSAVEGHTRVAQRLLRRMHRGQEDFSVVVPLRLLLQSRAQQRVFNLVMGLIAGISLVVGGIGIMNVMLASVMERTREIGVRLALGARPRDVRRLFLVESSLISLTGGALGVLAGVLIALGVAAFTGWATAVSVEAVAIAAVLSTAEGIVFGFVPAQRAASLPPVVALRQVG